MHHLDIAAWQHGHAFQAGRNEGERRTQIVLGLTASMMIVEIAVGLASGSMALLADGLHMGSHAVGIGLAAFAYGYARRHAADNRFTFGTGKVNSLAGFTGALLLAGFAALMAFQSVERLINPVIIAFDLAIVVAVIGLVVNAASALILRADHDHGHYGRNHHSHDHHAPDSNHAHDALHSYDAHADTADGKQHEDHNLRSAYLHVLADAVTSMTAIFALLAAKYLGLTWADPLMGVVGSILILYWARGLLRETVKVLLDHQAPDAVVTTVRSAIEADDDNRVSDLHIWRVAPAEYAAAVGLVTHTPRPAAHYRELIPEGLGIVHVTVEVNECADAP